MRREIQKTSATCNEGGKGEAQRAFKEGIMRRVAIHRPERPNFNNQLMEEVLERNNLVKALKRVRKNKGAPGIDGMTVDELQPYLDSEWPNIRARLFSSSYKPLPVRRVEIPKPNGGIRKLGIPTVLDRLIQQALHQVLQIGYDPTFSEHSYGFRPNRSAHQAIAKAQNIQREGYNVVVDIDLEKFFDTVNHDRLMGRMAKDIKDKRVLKLIRSYLRAGIMHNGLVTTPDEGAPQGGPLSPLLSNVVLDELDKELERRGHQFVRYADDCNIYVKSRRAGERVMKSVSQHIEQKLKLKVNQSKSSVTSPSKTKFLGFSFTNGQGIKRRIAPQSIKRFKDRIRLITRGTRRISMLELVKDLKKYINGWIGYFGFCETDSVLRDLDSWIRRRLRNVIWQQWKKFKTRVTGLTKFRVNEEMARKTASSGKGSWRISRSPAMSIAFPSKYFDKIGVPRLLNAKFQS